MKTWFVVSEREMEWSLHDPQRALRKARERLSGGAIVTGERWISPNDCVVRVYVDVPDDPTGLLF